MVKVLHDGAAKLIADQSVATPEVTWNSHQERRQMTLREALKQKIAKDRGVPVESITEEYINYLIQREQRLMREEAQASGKKATRTQDIKHLQDRLKSLLAKK